MTPQENDLITTLLTRLKSAGGQPKDPEAEALIRQAMTDQPDGPYYLTQTVLIQDLSPHVRSSGLPIWNSNSPMRNRLPSRRRRASLVVCSAPISQLRPPAAVHLPARGRAHPRSPRRRPHSPIARAAIPSLVPVSRCRGAVASWAAGWA